MSQIVIITVQDIIGFVCLGVFIIIVLICFIRNKINKLKNRFKKHFKR